jgi:4-diphosphocytidyl-2-C-methyl-D-erythritol kinase
MNYPCQDCSQCLEAPAKVNLTLDILGKRTDGYHELATVMHQINLVDRINLKRGGTELRVSSNSAFIPVDEENLAYKAAQLIFEKFAVREGLQIYIEKNIPVGAGLAGGSTDAATVLYGINHLFGLGMGLETLLDLGARIGSDVPFCLLGGTALACGRGEILTPLTEGPPLHMVLVKPDFQISTREVYQAFRLEKVNKSPDNPAFLAAWRNYDIINVAQEMNNVLETVSIEEHPEIALIKQQLLASGALNALMSGSGPTVFGLYASSEEAGRAFKNMQDKYKEAFLVSSYRRSERHDG